MKGQEEMNMSKLEDQGTGREGQDSTKAAGGWEMRPFQEHLSSPSRTVR